MFRNDAQRAYVCMALCECLNKGALWTSEGPTDQALAWRESNPLSSGEKVILSIAWACWNDENPGPTFVELLRLDPPRMRMVAELLEALPVGSDAVDSWCERWGD